MKFLPFVFKHLLATWVRTASTIISMALCVFLFCTLRSVLAHLDGFIRGDGRFTGFRKSPAPRLRGVERWAYIADTL